MAILDPLYFLNYNKNKLQIIELLSLKKITLTPDW